MTDTERDRVRREIAETQRVRRERLIAEAEEAARLRFPSPALPVLAIQQADVDFLERCRAIGGARVRLDRGRAVSSHGRDAVWAGAGAFRACAVDVDVWIEAVGDCTVAFVAGGRVRTH